MFFYDFMPRGTPDIETEEKLLDCSGKGSSVAVSQRSSRVLSRRGSGGSIRRSSRAELGRDAEVLESLNELISTTRDGPAKRLANDYCNKIDVKERTKAWVKGISDCTKNVITVLKQIASNLRDENRSLLQLIKTMPCIITSNDKEELNTSI